MNIINVLYFPSQNPTLRYSLCLCDEEKEFLLKRRIKVMEGMKELLGSRAPKSVDEVCICFGKTRHINLLLLLRYRNEVSAHNNWY